MTLPACIDTGEGPPVVFLHGIGGNADNWIPQLAGLSGRYRCIAWNAPGYGGVPALPEMTFPALADALARLLDDLAVGDAVICGLSMGGYLAQEFHARHPHRVRGLVLMCTTASFGKPGGDFQRAFLEQRLKPIDEGRTPADIAPAIAGALAGPGAGAELRNVLIRSMARIPTETYRAALHCLVTFDRRDHLASIEAPVCLIAAEADETAPAAAMERMAGHLPHAEFHVVPRAGHLVNLEAPERVNRLLAQFLAGLES